MHFDLHGMAADSKLRAALIGHPVSHSKSSLIYKRLSELTGEPLDYGSFDVDPSDLEGCFSEKFPDFFKGFNVTVPHKENIIKYCAELSEEARITQAGNLILNKNGVLIAHNTDVFGFEKSFSESYSGVLRDPFESNIPADVFVYGAGGASRAVIFALDRMGVHRIHIYSRNQLRTVSLIQSMSENMKFSKLINVDFKKKKSLYADAFVNATPVGLEGFIADTSFLKNVYGFKMIFDLVYHSSDSPFLRESQYRGSVYVDGKDMLVYQAMEAWGKWFSDFEFDFNECAKDLKEILMGDLQ